METVIEKAVELGVYEIIPVAMKYCVVKLEGKRQHNGYKMAGAGRDCSKTVKAQYHSKDS